MSIEGNSSEVKAEGVYKYVWQSYHLHVSIV
jgi:hypothetical protein